MESKTYNFLPDPRAFSGNGSKNIYLTVTIGNGQIGANYVTLGENILAKGDLSNTHLLGTFESLHAKTIVLQTNVLDINSYTNQCVITTTFTGDDNVILAKNIDNGEAPEKGIAIFIGNYIIK